MKITHINGITHIRLDHVDELATAMAMLPTNGEHRVEIIMPDAAAPIAPEPQPMPVPIPFYAQQMLPDMPDPGIKKRGPLSAIGTVYVTPNTIEVMNILRGHESGLTTRQMAKIAYRDELEGIPLDSPEYEENLVFLISKMSSHLGAAHKEHGQVRKIGKTKIWVLSELGKTGRVEIDAKPLFKNKYNKGFNRYLTRLKAGEVE